MRIYLAGAFEDKVWLMRIAQDLRAMGHTITSTWLDETHGPTPGLEHKFATEAITPERAVAYAIRDLGEIQGSDMVLVDTLSTNVRAGREVEFGYALAQGIPVRVVGPRRNVFHQLVPQFDTWGEALKALEGWRV